MKKIVVENTNNLPTLPFSVLKERFEMNALKEAKNRDVGDLKRLIIKFGFKIPLIIWVEGSYIIDGTGRLIALGLLEYEGYEIPEIPYMTVSAKDRKEAKEMALAISSQFGEITEDTLSDFVLDLGESPDLGLYNFPGLNLDEVKFSPKPLLEKPKKERGTAKSKLVHKCPNCHHEFSSSEEK